MLDSVPATEQSSELMCSAYYHYLQNVFANRFPVFSYRSHLMGLILIFWQYQIAHRNVHNRTWIQIENVCIRLE